MIETKLRPIQEKIIQKIQAAIDSGKTDIFIQAPTGTGKGLISLSLASGFNSYLLTSEKSLQQQYEDDINKFTGFDEVKSICGTDTYKCNLNNEKFSLGVCRSLGLSNQDAMKLPCAENCQYLQRWKAASAAPQSVMNYSYFLVQMNYVLEQYEENAPFNKREIVICDEAHKLPDIIESHFACTIDLKIIDQITRTLHILQGGNLMRDPIETQPLFDQIIAIIELKKDVHEEIYLKELRRLTSKYAEFLQNINVLKSQLARQFLSKSGSSKDLEKKAKKLPREVRNLLSLADNIKDRHCKIEDYVNHIAEHGAHNLIVDSSSYQSKTFHNLSDENLFRKHFERFSDVRIYLSATLQPDLLIKRWGIDPKKAAVMFVDSEWDDAKSRVVLCNTANMSYANTENSMRDIVRKINELMVKHKDDRGVIHTTSNAITEDICSNIHKSLYCRLVRYSTTAEKMEILSTWDKYPPDAVLIGPSLTTGIDLSDDLARFNIIVKLSYPNMGSALWAKRAKLLPHIYVGETASVLEQAAGRTTRSISDSSRIYVLDSRAEKFMLQNQKYFSPSFLKRVRNE